MQYIIKDENFEREYIVTKIDIQKMKKLKGTLEANYNWYERKRFQATAVPETSEEVKVVDATLHVPTGPRVKNLVPVVYYDITADYLRKPKLVELIERVLAVDEEALQELMTIDVNDCLLINYGLLSEVNDIIEQVRTTGKGLGAAIVTTKALAFNTESAVSTTQTYLTSLRSCITAELQDEKEVTHQETNAGPIMQ